MKRGKWVIALALALLGAGLSVGCSVVDQSRVNRQGGENIPWNTKADWEGGIFGAPF